MGKSVRTGKHFWYGNIAIAEGAIVAGCRFFAGYPITPATEVAEHISRRFPEIGGKFIQFEDELASMAAVLGASWAGAKSMTATSGPGLSLMMENFGLGVMNDIMPRSPKINTRNNGIVFFMVFSYLNMRRTGTFVRSPSIDVAINAAPMMILPQSSPLIAPRRSGSFEIYAEAA